MPLAFTTPPEGEDQALARAQDLDLLPTTLTTEGLRQLSRGLRNRSLFSARVAHAGFLSVLRSVIVKIGAGEMGEGEARIALLKALQALGYKPERGFGLPEEQESLEANPVVAGSLQDISSYRRRDLILQTQIELMDGAGQKALGETPEAVFQFPAWELIRVFRREVPRNWVERWEDAGGTVLQDPSDGIPRLIAPKGDILWNDLGSSLIFDDALDVDHPPFAFNSGKRWRAVPRREWLELLEANQIPEEDLQPDSDQQNPIDPAEPVRSLPRPKAGIKGMDSDFLQALREELDTYEDDNGNLTMDDILDSESTV